MRLKDRVAIVTGVGPKTIGEGYARALVREGAKVACADIVAENAQAVVDAIKSEGGEAVALRVDVGDEASTKSMGEEVGNRYGGIDILVNNAAIFHPGVYAQEAQKFSGANVTRDMTQDLLTMPIDWWNRYLAVNMSSVLLCTRAVLPYMKDRGQGRIINQASIGAYMRGSNGAYGIAKLGVIGLTRGLAAQLDQYNITVNAIAPSAIETEALSSLYGARPAAAPGVPKSITPAELAKTLIFIASDDSSFFTGHVFILDGGTLMPL